MKLLKKIFIGAFLIGILLFFLCSMIITAMGHQLNLQNQSKYTTDLSNKLSKELNSRFNNISLADREIKITIYEYFIEIRESYIPDNIHFMLSINGTSIYNDFNRVPDEPKYDFGYTAEKNFTYIEIGNDTFLSVKSPIVINDDTYTFTVINDLHNIYQISNTQLELLPIQSILLSTILASVITVFMFFFTSPLKQLNKAVKMVSTNSYSYRLPTSEGKDEFSEIVDNFNVMCNTIEENITNYKRSIDNFTHEVKTPLTSIIGYADLLKTGNCDEETKEMAVDFILNEGKRLNSLTKKIMNLLIIESEQVETNRINICDLVSMVYMTTIVQANLKNIKIDYDVSEHVFMYGDNELMITLLVNLIDNAIKASPNNSHIKIKIHNKNNALCKIEIIDKGIGIPKEDLAHITEAFYMVDKGRSRSENGVGLGLSICNSIMQVHNATMNIDSTEGVGTHITLSFPFQTYLSIGNKLTGLMSSTPQPSELNLIH